MTKRKSFLHFYFSHLRRTNRRLQFEIPAQGFRDGEADVYGCLEGEVSRNRLSHCAQGIIGGALLVLVTEALELARKFVWIFPIAHEVRKFVVRQQFRS